MRSVRPARSRWTARHCLPGGADATAGAALASALETFTPSARIHDLDSTLHGTSEIREWLAASTQFTYIVESMTASVEADGDVLVSSHLEGAFPGAEMDLGYRFTLDDGLI